MRVKRDKTEKEAFREIQTKQDRVKRAVLAGNEKNGKLVEVFFHYYSFTVCG